jgi:predicted nucleic acid-binding protein
MKAADASVAVAAFASWHEFNSIAHRAVPGTRLVAHAAAETFSVLTRLPPPHRAPADLVARYLDQQFHEPWLALSHDRSRAALLELADRGVTGGATYDALVAVAAREAGAVLLSCDRRAAATYERVGAAYELLAG